MASPDDAIDVDVPPSPRIKRGKGDANEPLELVSSDSEDEKPAKRAKPAPVRTPRVCSAGARAPCRGRRRRRGAPERRPPSRGPRTRRGVRCAAAAPSRPRAAPASRVWPEEHPQLFQPFYKYSKHSASDDAGVSVFRLYQDLAPRPQETVNRFALVDLMLRAHPSMSHTLATRLWIRQAPR